MSGSSSVLEAFGPRPLNASEWAEAQRVWDRLRAELGQLINGLPEHARHASGLARELDVLRVTCQRVVAALSIEAGSPTAIVKLPGPEGLRQFVGAFKGVGAKAAQIDAADAAVSALERLITVTGGSQTKLNERLLVSAGGGGGAGSVMVSGSGARAGEHAGSGSLATLVQRQALHEAAAAVTGRACEVGLSVYAFRPHPESPLTLERALCKGVLGAVVAPGGLPLVLGSGDTLHTEEALLSRGLAPQAHGRTAETILSAFTTQPLPTVTSRSRTGSLHQVIDPAAFAAGESRPVDVVTALKACHLMYEPATGMPTLDAVWSLVNCPSARLIFDVYLHADMERLFRPSIDALIWGPDLNAPIQDRWTTRLPNQPRLQLLGRGLSHAASEQYARHAELSQAFFGHIGWDPDDFVGFRCEVRYPVWRAGYCMGFEYLGAPGPKAMRS